MIEMVGFSPRSEEETRMYGPLALAYIGDGIYELLVRSYLTCQGSAPVNKLHSRAKEFVRADAQSHFADLLMEELTSREIEIFKRGRNAKPHTTAKNMSIGDYMKATGLETLFGYLYLIGNSDRINALFSKIIEAVEKE